MSAHYVSKQPQWFPARYPIPAREDAWLRGILLRACVRADPLEARAINGTMIADGGDPIALVLARRTEGQLWGECFP